MDGHDIFHIDLLKNCDVLLKKTTKDARVGPFFKKTVKDEN